MVLSTGMTASPGRIPRNDVENGTELTLLLSPAARGGHAQPLIVATSLGDPLPDQLVRSVKKAPSGLAAGSARSRR